MLMRSSPQQGGDMQKNDKVLLERTQKVAKAIRKEESGEKTPFLVFEVNEKLFAIPNDDILIITTGNIMRALERIDEPFTGIVNLKGYVYNVLDLNLFFKHADTRDDKNLIFLKKYYIAFCFDIIMDTLGVPAKEIMRIDTPEIPFIGSFFKRFGKEIYIIDVRKMYETYAGS